MPKRTAVVVTMPIARKYERVRHGFHVEPD
jgi:hypothetical protein